MFSEPTGCPGANDRSQQQLPLDWPNLRLGQLFSSMANLPVNQLSWQDRLLQSLFEHALDAIVVVDGEGNYIEANPAACELLGCDRDGLSDHQLFDLCELDSEQSRQRWQSLLNHGSHYRGECCLVCLGGDRRWVEFTLAINVLPQHHLLIMRDISDRKRAEKDLQTLNHQLEQRVQMRTQELEAANAALSQEIAKYQQSQAALQVSEARYRAVLADQTELICRFRADGTIVYVNPSYCRYFRLTEADLIGQTFGEFIPPEQREFVASQFNSLTRDQPVQTYEHEVVLPSGEVRWQEWTDRAIFDPLGNLTEFQAVGRDVTDRKQAEIALAESQAINQAIIQALPDFVIRMHRDGTYLQVYCQGAGVRLFNEALVQPGKTIFEILPTEVTQARMALVEAALETGELQTHEYALDFGSEIRHKEARIAPLGPDEVLVVVRDITARRQLETNLQISRLKYQTLFETLPLGLSITDDTGQVIEANPASVEILGLPVQTHCARRYDAPNWQIIRPDGTLMPSAEYASVQALTQNRVVQNVEMGIVRSDGSVRWLSVTAAPIPLPRYGVAIAYVDITALKQSELALRASEEPLRLALAAAQMGTWEWNIQTNEVIWSESMAALMGITLAEFDGTFEAIREMIHPDDLDRVIADITRTLKPGHHGEYTSEFRFIRPDGQVRWVLGKGKLLRDQSGQPLRLVGVDLDFTARKRAEEALQVSRNQYQELVQSIRGVVWEYDLETRCFSFISDRAEEMFGYPIYRWLNEPEFWASCVHPDDRDWAVNYYNQAVCEGRDHTFEYRLVRADGQVVWVEDIVTVQRLAGGSAIVRGVLTDISDRKQIEEGLHQYQLIVAALPEATVLISADYVYQVVNPTYCQWHQRPESEILGRTVADLIGKSVFTTTLKPLIDRAPAGEVVHHQNWFHYPRCGRQFIDIVYAPYQDLKSQIVGVVATLRNITLLKQAEMRLLQQARQEQLLVGMTDRIRRSLDLPTLLTTLVTEVRDYLEVDRVLVCQFNTPQTGQVIAESGVEGYLSLQNFHLKDPCWAGAQCQAAYQNHEVRCYEDIHTSTLSDCYRETLASFQVRALAVIPILSGDRVWGLILAHQCRGPRPWPSEELDLLKQLTSQISIAINQSELYGQIQRFNTELEDQVQTRTAELQQSLELEAVLKRIGDKVRSSLDEAKILQAAVDELAEYLDASSCDISIYDLAKEKSTVRYEVARPNMPVLFGQTFSISVSQPIYSRLFRGETVHFCWLAQGNPLRITDRTVCLACPIVDNETILGDIWIHRLKLQPLNQMEINLVEQVANQCAIALRQAKLYQAAQAQVTELARLNQLKDDFLSTISHELRTPISSIKMATQMLEITLSRLGITGPQAEENHCDRYLQILREESQRETDLINNLLALTQADAGVEPLMPAEINLQLWITHISEGFHNRIQSHQQTLQLDVPANITLVTDIPYLEKILTELLTNACKYSPAGELIQISARLVNCQVEIEVSNSGVEIPLGERDRIFEKFYRIPSHDPWKYSGTGLGLALVQKLVDRLQGTIQVASTQDQVQFILRLPQVLPASQP